MRRKRTERRPCRCVGKFEAHLEPDESGLLRILLLCAQCGRPYTSTDDIPSDPATVAGLLIQATLP